MMKRMMFLAAGLAASLAFATSSYAGTVAVDFSVTGGTATDVTLFYAADTTVSVVSSTGIGVPTIAGNGTTSVEINFGTASSLGTILLSESGPPPVLYGLSGLSVGYTKSQIQIIPTGAVPEPASMALLGIGMTSFLAFRRFFNKRNSVV
jgi:hypothetical protein